MRMSQTIRIAALHRHVHKHAYATLVLSGHYQEAGDSGRHLARPGDVVLHDALEAHRNRFPFAATVSTSLCLTSMRFSRG